MKPPKPRNPVARALRGPRFSKKIVRSSKTYTRKGRTAHDRDDGNTPRSAPLRWFSIGYRRRNLAQDSPKRQTGRVVSDQRQAASACETNGGEYPIRKLMQMRALHSVERVQVKQLPHSENVLLMCPTGQRDRTQARG